MSDLAKGRRNSADRQIRCRTLLAATLAAAFCCGAAAQGGGRPGGGGPGGHGPGFPGGGPGGLGDRGPGGGSDRGGTANRGALQRGPAGRWWDDTQYARSVGLTGDQQRRMDGVFSENRSTLIANLDNLRKAEARLSALSTTDHPSESALNTEIQSVAQARADLEKANTHLLLQLRNEMTQAQLNKLEKLQ